MEIDEIRLKSKKKKENFQMHPHISIRGYAHLSAHPSIHPSCCRQSKGRKTYPRFILTAWRDLPPFFSISRCVLTRGLREGGLECRVGQGQEPPHTRRHGWVILGSFFIRKNFHPALSKIAVICLLLLRLLVFKNSNIID